MGADWVPCDTDQATSLSGQNTGTSKHYTNNERIPNRTEVAEARWQQKPASEEGGIIKREWWQLWDEEEGARLDTRHTKVMIRRSVKKKRQTILRLQRGACSVIHAKVIRK